MAGAFALLGLGACGDDEGGPSGDDAADTDGDDDDDDDDDAPGDDDDDDDTPGDDDDTTGGEELCGLEPGGAPAFVLYDGTKRFPSADATLPVECGGQGSFMFSLRVDISGVDTYGEEWVPFDVTVQVPGVEGDPGDDFMSRSTNVYVGCEIFDGHGGDVTRLDLPLPDLVWDPTDLDGLSFDAEFVMMPGTDQEVTFTSNGTILADGSGWDWCFGGGSGGETAGGTGGPLGGSGEGGGGTGDTEG